MFPSHFGCELEPRKMSVLFAASEHFLDPDPSCELVQCELLFFPFFFVDDVFVCV